MIQNESRDPFGGNVYNVTMQITFLTRKFRNGERNLLCDVVHITTVWVSSLTLDRNGVSRYRPIENIKLVYFCYVIRRNNIHVHMVLEEVAVKGSIGLIQRET